MDTLEISRLAVALETERLILRVPADGDAPSIKRRIGDWDVARMLGRVPYPYPEGAALDWIGEVRAEAAEGRDLTLVLVEKDNPVAGAIGCVGLHTREGKDAPELGYWLAKTSWGRGLMTEAAGAAVDFGFRSLAIETIEAGYLPDNQASAKVLRKLGFRDAGQEQRWSRPRNCETTVILMTLTRRDYLSAQDRLA